MKNGLKSALGAVLMAAVVAVALAPDLSEAKRLGGGKSLGMQRSTPPPQRPNATPDGKPAQPAANPGAAAAPVAGAAAATPKRSWMGPIAGLAAGLGIAALMSHLGLGEAFGNFLVLALLAVVAVIAIRLLVQRFGRNGSNGKAPAGLQFAGAAGGNANGLRAVGAAPVPFGGGSVAAPRPVDLAKAPVVSIPPDFDTDGFERIAKSIFIRLQAANDKADLTDLRHFTTPAVFAELRLDLQERGPSPQQTDVVEVHADVIEVAQEAERQVVSVRFHGLIREDLSGAATAFDEVWHLQRQDGEAAWAISGIQQRAPQAN